jgi:hypothetical protein
MHEKLPVLVKGRVLQPAGCWWHGVGAYERSQVCAAAIRRLPRYTVKQQSQYNRFLHCHLIRTTFFSRNFASKSCKKMHLLTCLPLSPHVTCLEPSSGLSQILTLRSFTQIYHHIQLFFKMRHQFSRRQL